jgi:hypothetical protein
MYFGEPMRLAAERSTDRAAGRRHRRHRRRMSRQFHPGKSMTEAFRA